MVDGGSADHDAAAGLLQSLGYRVLRSADAHCALAVLQAGGPIDLLLVDGDTPEGWSSPELVRRARQANAGIAIMLTGGGAQEADGHCELRAAGVELLARPCRPDELAQRLRHLLANQQQVNALARALSEARRLKAAPDQAT